MAHTFHSSVKPIEKAKYYLSSTVGKLASAAGKPSITPKRTLHTKSPQGSDLANLVVGATLQNGASAQIKPRLVNHFTLQNLVRSDPVTWAIIRMTKGLINQTPWDIVPDVNGEFDELDRFYDQACDQIYPWAYSYDFESNILDPETLGIARTEVKSIIKDTSTDEREKRMRLETLFRILKRQIEQAAMANCKIVKGVFSRPNNHLEKSLRALQELVVNDLCTDDAGVIIKNTTPLGRLAELYTVPGWQIIPIMYKDFTVPQPPDPAYIWSDGSKILAFYTNDELTYMMENPMGNGYGMSPVETLLWVITASILGDNSFIKNLQEGFMPPGLLNLKEANDDQLRKFQSLLDKFMQRSGGNRIMAISGVPSEDGEFQWQEFPRGADFQKLQVMQYLSMAPGIKAFAFGYQAGDLGLITQVAGPSGGSQVPADVQAQLSQRRAITGRLSLIEAYYNAEIVKTCFPEITNVRFAYEMDGGVPPDLLKQAQSESISIASGVLSVNDARRKRKMRPVPGGNIYTKATGNALINVDAMEYAGADDDEGVEGGNPAVVTPTVSTDPKKRNNANKRQQMNGTESRANNSK